MNKLATLFSKINHYFLKKSFDREKQTGFLRDLAELLEYGIPVSVAVKEILSNIYTDDVDQKVVQSLAQALTAGKPIAEGMQPWFDPFTVVIVKIGEAGGNLAEAVRNASEGLGKRQGLLGNVMGAIIYPALVFCAAIGLVILFRERILPLYQSIIPINRWPALSQAYYHFADFVAHAWYIFFLCVGILIITFTVTVHRYTGFYRIKIDRWPFFSLYRGSQASLFLELLGMLMLNGMAIKPSLSFIRDTADKYIYFQTTRILRRLTAGFENIAGAMDIGFLEKGDIARLTVLSSVGKMEGKLKEIGTNAYERVIRKTRKYAKIMGSILFICAGMILLFSFISIYITAFSISSAQ